MKRPKFSLITITKDNAKGLNSTLASIEAQRCRDYEVIVIDGHSTDSTSEVIATFRDTISTFQSEHEPGIYKAMNQAVGLASGEWTMFLNSGDRFFEASVLESFSPDQKTDLAYGRAWIDGAKGPAQYNGLSNIWKGQPFCHQALFTRTCQLQNRPFDSRLRIAADYKFIVQAYVEGLVFEDLDRDICWIEPPGVSGQRILLRLAEKYSIARRAFPDRPVGLVTLKQATKSYFLVARRRIAGFKASWFRDE